MNVKSNLIKAVFALLSTSCSTFAFSTVFLGGVGTDRPSAVATDPATGEFYVAGTLYVGAAAKNDMCVTKFSASGAPIWSYTAGGAGDDVANDIVLRGGFVYVAGTVQPGAASDTNAIVYRLTAAGGALAGVQLVSTALDDAGRFVRVDAAGSVYLGGYSSGAGNRDFMLAKFTGGLLPVFTVSWGGAAGGRDEPMAMGLSPNGVHLAGYATSPAGNLDGVVGRFSGVGGALVNLKVMAGTAGLDDFISDIAIDNVGMVYLSGNRNMVGVGDEARIAKFNAALTLNIWATSLNYAPAAGSDRANKIKLTSGGMLTVGGRSWNVIGTGYDAFVTRLTRGGGVPGVPWLYNAVDHDEVVGLAEGSAGDHYALLYTDGLVGHDIGIARVDASAVSPWVKVYNVFNHDEPAAMAMAGPGRLVVTGASENAGVAFDWCLMGWDPSGAMLF